MGKKAKPKRKPKPKPESKPPLQDPPVGATGGDDEQY
jgi:hypothetical protein